MSEETHLILASKSKSRAEVLRGAGIAFEQMGSKVDEDAIKLALRADGVSTREQAAMLAEMKAVKVSRSVPGIVLGADQMLDLEGIAFDKPHTREQARLNLKAMRGKTHTLETALVACQNGEPIWRTIVSPKLTMRNFTDSFLEAYLERIDDWVLGTVGGYALEGEGVQLFSNIDGDYFSILGMPLFDLLAWLRERGVVQK